jgi:hypothetical protein
MLTGFPPREDESPPPPDISDPWVGPSTYAEDFYSGGDVAANATDAHILPTEAEGEENENTNADGKSAL